MHFMDKKGILTKNTVTLLIAAIGIGLILAGGGKLYAQVREGQESERAQEIINSVEAKIKALNDGESSELVVRGLGGWFLDGWSEDASFLPDKCFFKSCVCICKIKKFSLSELGARGGRINPDEISAENCQRIGFCREVERKTIFIHSTVTVEESEFRFAYDSTKTKYTTEDMKGIDFSGESFIKLIIEKLKDSLKISADLRDGEK